MSDVHNRQLRQDYRYRQGGDNDAEEDNQLELLMRHSSPLIVPNASRTGTVAVASPLTERNSSPSPLQLNRPRSNPRNRTPMRYTSPLAADAFRGPIPEEEGAGNDEARRISIRPMAGRAVGTTMGAAAATHYRVGSRRQLVVAAKSRKQGPSHRKIRRWNNDNFVNLAAEINNGKKKGASAAQALLLGQADASEYRPIIDPEEHTCKVMTRLREDDSLKGVKEKFFAGELSAKPARSAPTKRVRETSGPMTPEQMLHRMDARLRRIVVKACENSVPASAVVERFEAFLLDEHYRTEQESDQGSPREVPLVVDNWWKDILMEAPSTTTCSDPTTTGTDTGTSRFLFEGDHPNGGFHRLLLHGLCQFHGLQASSTTVHLTDPQGGSRAIQARMLTATGTMVAASQRVHLVNYIMLRKGRQSDRYVHIQPKQGGLDEATSQMRALKV